MITKLRQEIEEYLDRDYCCEFKEECKNGTRIRCAEYEAKLYLILRFVEPKIAELEKEIKQLGERCNQLLKEKGELTDKVTRLGQQIEKMKADLKVAMENADYLGTYSVLYNIYQDCFVEITKGVSK